MLMYKDHKLLSHTMQEWEVLTSLICFKPFTAFTIKVGKGTCDFFLDSGYSCHKCMVLLPQNFKATKCAHCQAT